MINQFLVLGFCLGFFNLRSFVCLNSVQLQDVKPLDFCRGRNLLILTKANEHLEADLGRNIFS